MKKIVFLLFDLLTTSQIKNKTMCFPYFSLYNNFGVDEGDIANASFAAQFGMEGLKALWVLQHQRGYKPFKTISCFSIDIYGKI